MIDRDHKDNKIDAFMKFYIIASSDSGRKEYKNI